MATRSDGEAPGVSEQRAVHLGLASGHPVFVGAGLGTGEVSLQVILLCTKHFNSLDKYDVDHP